MSVAQTMWRMEHCSLVLLKDTDFRTSFSGKICALTEVVQRDGTTTGNGNANGGGDGSGDKDVYGLDGVWGGNKGCLKPSRRS